MIKDQVKVNGVQYRLVVRKCGKKTCKCNIPGQEHGPYWYAYDGMSAAKYVGSQLPEWVTKHLQLLKTKRQHIKSLRAQIRKRLEKHEQEVSRAQRELSALTALEFGEYTASEVLNSLGLGELNGHGE